jgi:hypothetical protein
MLTCSVGMQFQTMKRPMRTRSNARIRSVEHPDESRNLNVYTLQMRGNSCWLHVDFLPDQLPVWDVHSTRLAAIEGERHRVE